ncbi:MAG: hypothetical protein JXN64_15200 [Spirochaetes bacterium]|nr:hypothetical protein [Spirochaetota bacterium]
MIKRLIPCLIILNLIYTSMALSSEFDELDKPPEGAHEGQILLGAFFAFGWPKGQLIDAENDFLKDSYYTFDSSISKSLEVSHQSYALGISAEYMPVNHFGAQLRLRRTYIVQSTTFGSEYENWKGYLYRDIAFYLGTAIHATTRKSWDFVFIPFIGYSMAKYNATPVAKKILQNYDPVNPEKYSGDMSRESNGLSYGAELNCSIYFTGGLYISMGAEWIRNKLKFDRGFDLTNPQTNRRYSGSSGTIDTYSVIITAGYAFSN